MNDSQCSVFRDLSESVAYHVIMATKGCLCSIGAVRISMQWRKHGARFLVHENTKTIFHFYYAVNILIGAIFGFVHLFELIRLRFDCFLIDFRLILATRGVAISSAFAAHHLILLMSLERLYSAVYPAHFERNSSKILSFSVAFTTVSVTYVYCMMDFSNVFRLFYGEKLEVALLTINTAENKEGFKRVVSNMAITTAMSILTLIADVYLNFIQKPARGNTSLAVTYQRSENRRVVLILIPIEITQSLMGSFTGVALSVYGKFVSCPDPISHQLFHESVTLTVIFPFFLAFFIERAVERQNAKRPIHTDAALEDYFKSLRHAWN